MNKFLWVMLLFVSCFTNSNRSNKFAKSVDQDISDTTNTLNSMTDTLELNYIVWDCACANWAMSSDLKKYQGDKLSGHCIYIEPATEDLKLPLYFDPARHFVKVSGQFYKNPGYPKGTVKGVEHLKKAKVFRYTTIEIFRKDIEYSPQDDTAFNLFYNAISCNCPQWSDMKVLSDSTRQYYYLEPAYDHLINADKLWKGYNLPLQIQVTGQIISNAGFPTGYNPGKGDPKTGKVIRYTKIKILKNGQKKNSY